jgi:hypothetical protein
MNRFYNANCYRKKEVVYLTLYSYDFEQEYKFSVSFALDFINFLYYRNEEAYPSHRKTGPTTAYFHFKLNSQLPEIHDLLNRRDDSEALNLLSENSLLRDFEIYRSKLKC